MIIVIDEHNVFKIEIGSLDDVGFGLVFARIFCEDVRTTWIFLQDVKNLYKDLRRAVQVLVDCVM